MRVVHLCLAAFFIDDFSYQENMLPKYHVRQGHDVTVIASLFTYDKSGKRSFFSNPCRYCAKDGFNVIRLAYRKPVRWNRFFRHYVGLKQELEKIDPDCIFMHNTSFGDSPVVRGFLKKHPNVRVFADNHADYINSAKNWFSLHFLHPIIWRYYTKVLEPYIIKYYGVTPMRCRFIKEMYKVNPDIIDFLPLGVDDDLIPDDRSKVRSRVRQELGLDAGDFLIISGGKIDRLKNTHVLINAVRVLNNPRIHVVICGVITPEMSGLYDEIKDSPWIHYLGWCDAVRVIDCMLAADLACFPGTHSTLWEQSVGVGLPSVFKRWPEMEHVNINGNCIFVQGEDDNEIANVIGNLFSDKVAFARIKESSIEASGFFLYSDIARKSLLME